MAIKNKTLKDWLEYIESIHPESIEFGLERVGIVFRRLFPEGLAFPVITVAGTNGKGSCCAYIESILQSSGYLVGKYTSPHLVTFNERIVVNSGLADDDAIVAAFENIEIARQGTILTYFEYTTLAAMLVFSQKEIGVGVFEVGLGGRLDAVNILDPIVSVITSIGIDHVDWLGDDRALIGLEKAAVARSGRSCIVGEVDVPESVKRYMSQNSVVATYIGSDVKILREKDNWSMIQDGSFMAEAMPLLQNDVDHQYRNAACAVLAVMNANLDVNAEAIREGLVNVAVEGRCQVLSRRPYIILDVAHNQDSVLALRDYVKNVPFKGRCYAVFSMLQDKDVHTCVDSMFDMVDEWNVASLNSPRSSSVDELESIIMAVSSLRKSKSSLVVTHTSIHDAFERVKNAVNYDDCIIVFGSFHVVGDILLNN